MKTMNTTTIASVPTVPTSEERAMMLGIKRWKSTPTKKTLFAKLFSDDSWLDIVMGFLALGSILYFCTHLPK